MGLIVDGRRAQQLKSLGAIEYPYHEYVRETFDVGESGFEFGPDLNLSFSVMFGSEAFWDLICFLVRTSNNADRLWCEHISELCHRLPCLR